MKTDDTQNIMPEKNKSSTVRIAFDSEHFADMLAYAASQERTIIEFQTNIVEGERTLDTAMDITNHVKELEDGK